MEKIIEVSNLSYRYNQNKSRSLSNVSFSVNKGEFFSIIGPNNSGKSTLCNALVGLIPHFFVGAKKGQVKIKNIDVEKTETGILSTMIGLVFPNPFNQLSYTTETVREELAYGLGNRGVPREVMLKKITKVGKKVSIQELLDRHPLKLSGGQVQRVVFGSTYILEPEILILDECTTQLDPMGAEKLMEIIKELNSEGVTIVMVDHDMERVAKYADNVMILKNGEVCDIGTPREIFTEENSKKYHIELPTYVRLSYALRKKGYWKGETCLTEAEALNMLQKVNLL